MSYLLEYIWNFRIYILFQLNLHVTITLITVEKWELRIDLRIECIFFRNRQNRIKICSWMKPTFMETYCHTDGLIDLLAVAIYSNKIEDGWLLLNEYRINTYQKHVDAAQQVLHQSITNHHIKVAFSFKKGCMQNSSLDQWGPLYSRSVNSYIGTYTRPACKIRSPHCS